MPRLVLLVAAGFAALWVAFAVGVSAAFPGRPPDQVLAFSAFLAVASLGLLSTGSGLLSCGRVARDLSGRVGGRPSPSSRPARGRAED